MASLLAVDLGLRTGLALFGQDGRLVWYRSRHFGTVSRLQRGVHRILEDATGLAVLVLEGGGPLAEVWGRAAERRDLRVRRISAEQWRRRFLYPRQQRTAPDAKRHAGALARRVIEWSGAPRPTSLRHDAAEAILLGLWGVLDAGWLTSVPAEVGQGACGAGPAR